MVARGGRNRRHPGARLLALSLLAGAALGSAAGAAGPTPAPAATLTAAPAGGVTGTASVVDADTIEIHGRRIRLEGVDAPESGQRCAHPDGRLHRCGAAAANALSHWIGRRTVDCTPTGVDRYDRMLARCSVAGEDVGGWLVRSGHALAYRRYSLDYVDEEAAAVAVAAGMWSGFFIAPWDWRRGLRLAQEPPTRAMREGRIG